VLDDAGHRRIVSASETVTLDLADVRVDASEIERALQDGIAGLDAERLRALAARFAGEFLEGLEIERSPTFAGWLLAQRRRWRATRIAVLEHLVRHEQERSSDAGVGDLEQWLQLAPLDRRAHEQLLGALARSGRLREGEEHLAAAARTFEAEGLDWQPLRAAWQAARAQPPPPPAESPTLAAPVNAPRAPAAVPGEPGAPSGSPDTPPASRGAPIASPRAPFASPSAPARRASIAVMPFDELGGSGLPGTNMAAGLAHDIITRLAKLRSLFVIAQGTVFALHERTLGAGEVGRTLDVDYVVGGSLRRHGTRIVVNVELSETRTARVVWAEVFDQQQDDAFEVLDEIGHRIVGSIAHEIEAVERERAILKPPSSLDAWEAYHRGLWHMYRFDRAENERARHFLEMAVRLDPGFARAHAGLSFTHFQDAFQGWEARQPAMDQAFATAERSLAVDDRDPAAHWSMGRALWLRGRQDPALRELDEAVQLSPNFALGHYTLAFVHSQSGDPQAAIAASDQSRLLSPFDPLLFGMLATRAMALIRLGRTEEAADWAVRAASRPNAHAHILAIATHCLALAGRREEAQRHAERVRQAVPGYGIDDFFGAFRFAPEAAALYRGSGLLQH
jgi:TolB-like protein